MSEQKEPSMLAIRECALLVLDLWPADVQSICVDFAHGLDCSADALYNEVSLLLRAEFKHTKAGKTEKRTIYERFEQREHAKRGSK